jgi:hypothetical protein
MKKKILIIILIVAVLVLAVPTLVGMAANGYEINWWTVDGGGGESSGGDYTLKGTIGQPDASNTLSGGDYALRGGFWVEGILTIVEFIVNLPLVLR